jgi:DNA-binding NarL/FixJ family response regulator
LVTDKNIACVQPSNSFLDNVNQNNSVRFDVYHSLSDLLTAVGEKSYSAVCINGNLLQDFCQAQESNIDAVIKCICQVNRQMSPLNYIAIDGSTDPKWLRICASDGYAGVVPDPNWQSKFEFEQAMCHILNQESYWPKKIWSWYLPKKIKSLANNAIRLTPRQIQILHMIKTRGASNKLIARHLKISESTVKVHVGAILKKYGVCNRTQLAVCNVPIEG